MSAPTFNEHQREVVEAADGPRLVLAPAGTGKTRVMAERLARALENGVDPDRTLCVTFTNRAAAEMRARIADRVPDHARRVHVRTFHGLCAWILRLEAPRLGLPRDYAIYDEEDAIELLRGLIKRGPTATRGIKASSFFWALSNRKSHAEGPELSLDRIPPLFLARGEDGEREIARRYHRHLAEWQALDFADLVYRVRALFTHHEGVADAWSRRFDRIQVDEVQDTHFSEYDVLRHLARRTGHLALFGDADQTIYEWRGSRPNEVFARFRADFDGVREHFLTLNYRATKELLRVADRFAATFERRRTQLTPHPSLPEGDPTILRNLPTEEEEARFIARCILKIRATDPEARIGVLGRSHQRLQRVSTGLTELGVEHLTVEQYEFFRRQEVKDAVARLKVLVNPFDSWSVRRMLKRPTTGVTDKKIDALKSGFEVGLRLVDLLRETTHEEGEPFGRLLRAFGEGRLVVFDVETTGLDTTEDEVVELAAQRIGADGDLEEFHRYLRPTRPVGESEAVHGHADAWLAEHGEPPAEVLAAFRDWVEGALLVGHNVRFDVAMVRHHARRVGVEFGEPPFEDTLDLARRFVPDVERHDLGTLAAALELPVTPTHRASDDVGATVALIRRLVPLLEAGAADRRRLVGAYGDVFAPVATSIESWRRRADELRPAVLLEAILEESGLRKFYAADRRRVANLEQLVKFLREFDRPEIDPRASLEELTSATALVKNVEFLGDDDVRVPVVTVHQSKGLEFDVVFVAGLNEGEFPTRLSEREGRLEEERRLFYVALTRAKRRLVLTSSSQDRHGPNRMSPFLTPLRADDAGAAAPF